ncbi:Sodium/hydrogen exchanger family-domain-containing protein [Neohortaea acidophila]|uniref:Sodium/hydrogen exchanger family-domain-containing protein n=1 Tax=Neohortaea acidophila TaxID=245834 RepID=A0A6A6PW10_9PEZI|nr:Sodium/hydrogen exchanger family-domain-containing protein [Neohortaea acidophila]KAF2483924.1 Sodium/hydrogen exchanger family-domain-containing protein [Neohortaea acidophila]
MATITRQVTQMVTTTVTAATSTSTARAPAQAGIFEGADPSVYNASNPIILFIIQASIILIFCRILHYPLSLLRQPRVIAEVIGGILLGPSVMGRIPGFTDAIFPPASIPNLSLVANLGLVLFLFLVGLEVDLRYFVSNWKLAVSVGVAGMSLPFGLGCAIAWGLYHQFHEDPDLQPIAFGTYMLFIGIAMAITAFPVLCRILTELKLLSTPVGVIVLSAGVGNDVVGWILLALCVALVNAQSGVTAVWVLLTGVGYALFLSLAVRPAFLWILRRSRALQDGPSQGIIALTLLMALSSAFFTGVIGIHPVFGAFMAGLICPHDGGFAIKVTEKIEDLVGALFLPLYFTLSGLSTNLGLLDNGITWAYVIGVIGIAFSAKFIGCAFAARANGLVWRESFTIGALMSCKGLVELIVLNIGLQAKILSTRTFTIFVVMALVTTFATTPLTRALYPPWYQRKLEAWKRGEIDWDSGAPLNAERQDSEDGSVAKEPLERVHPTHANEEEKESTEQAVRKARPLEVHGMRFVELNERNSTVMKVTEADELSAFDPVINAFRVLGQLYNLAVSGEVAISTESSFSESIVNTAVEESSDLLLLPWSESGSMSESLTVSKDVVKGKGTNDQYSSFVMRTLEIAECNAAVFVNRGFGGTLTPRSSTLDRRVSTMSGRGFREHSTNQPSRDRSHHIFAPYFGGEDGRAGLRLVLQLAENAETTATIVHYQSAKEVSPTDQTVSIRPKSGRDRLHKTKSAAEREDDASFFATLQRSLPSGLEKRVVFETATSSSPIEDAAAAAQEEVGRNVKNGGDLVVVCRRPDGMTGTPSCLGPIADAMLERGVKASLLVVQARRRDSGR